MIKDGHYSLFTVHHEARFSLFIVHASRVVHASRFTTPRSLLHAPCSMLNGKLFSDPRPCFVAPLLPFNFFYFCLHCSLL